MKQCLSAIRCPLCEKHMFLRGGSLICKKGHCFDLAKSGYVNFCAAKDETYPRALFESRQRVYRAGFYRPLTDEIAAVLSRYIEKTEPAPLLVDAGCGEGFFLTEILRRFPGRGIGFDISKEAVRLASRLSSDILWMAADLGNIPVKNGQASALLNILTPANYAEFSRVLQKGGLLIKVIPGPGYLKELRALAAPSLRSGGYSGEATLAYFKQNARLIETRSLAWSRPLDPASARDIARMTPMLSHVDIERLPLDSLTEISMEMEILIGDFPGKR